MEKKTAIPFRQAGKNAGADLRVKKQKERKQQWH